MSKVNYPRVLIIGQTFSGISGASITLRNLFQDWPKDKIAVASSNIYESDINTYKYCINNYRLGSKEISVLPPFNRFYSLKKSAIYNKQDEEKNNDTTNNRNGNSRLKQIVKRFLISTGINSVRLKYELSDSFIEWYENFNPQVIYSAVGDLDLIRFLMKIHEINNVPLVLHIWDDWPNTLADRSFLKRYWQRLIDNEFRNLIKLSSKLLSISEAMSKEYKELYNRDFIPFHNPINVEEWNVQIDLLNQAGVKVILYVGKINNDTFELLQLMSKAILLINSETEKSQYSFHIYSPDKGGVLDQFADYEGTIIFDAIPHEQVVNVMKNANILFLPLGFRKKSKKYTRLSMPTKASEYMISATPIIVMAPSEIALTKYAKYYKWAEIVEEKDLELLIKSILKLSSQVSFVKDITTNAVNLALERHDAIKVRNEFRLEIQESSRYD